jgi:hypothetical protein
MVNLVLIAIFCAAQIRVDLHQVHMNHQMEGCSIAQDCAIAAGECTLHQHVLLATHDTTGGSSSFLLACMNLSMNFV